jgi:hypothetical protein
MWRIIAHIFNVRQAMTCKQCGALLPSIKSDSKSIQSLRWACSPECYADMVDAIIQDSPGDEMRDGACWQDSLPLCKNVGACPSLRMQMHQAMEKFRGEFDAASR